MWQPSDSLAQSTLPPTSTMMINDPPPLVRLIKADPWALTSAASGFALCN